MNEGQKQQLKELLNQAPVMLFMKGNRNFPQCGFSGKAIQILKSTGVEYETFDIYLDEEVRQNLKEYSNWPTYPQLYVKGELIGGVDIMNEMQESGELENLLKEKSLL